jgi:hypothetical protein
VPVQMDTPMERYDSPEGAWETARWSSFRSFADFTFWCMMKLTNCLLRLVLCVLWQHLILRISSDWSILRIPHESFYLPIQVILPRMNGVLTQINLGRQSKMHRDSIFSIHSKLMPV